MSAAASARTPASRARSIATCKVEDCPALIERLLRAYLAIATRPDETFLQFSRRTDSSAR